LLGTKADPGGKKADLGVRICYVHADPGVRVCYFDSRVRLFAPRVRSCAKPPPAATVAAGKPSTIPKKYFEGIPIISIRNPRALVLFVVDPPFKGELHPYLTALKLGPRVK